jgi:hypothetical protein
LKLVPKERHRRFEIHSGPYYKVRYYEDSIGLIVLHDLSEGANEFEVIEKTPPWILELIRCMELMSDILRELIHEVKLLKKQVHRSIGIKYQ